MKIIKEIAGRIFALWAMIFFILTMLPVALAMWMVGVIDEPKRTAVFRIISKRWMQFFFFVSGCSLKVKGKENFVSGKNYIVICNHNSFMDVPVTTPYIPAANKTIAKIEMSKIPLFGLVYKRGAILVDRQDKASRGNSFKKMKEALAMGMHMCIYPEGTRNKTDKPLKEFHNGAFKLALETGKSILPALLFNTKKVLPPGKFFYFWPSKMEIHFLPAITISNKEDFTISKQTIFEMMSKYYTENKGKI